MSSKPLLGGRVLTATVSHVENLPLRDVTNSSSRRSSDLRKALAQQQQQQEQPQQQAAEEKTA
jgi:hypothetical protein